jgi:hypothetical protein
MTDQSENQVITSDSQPAYDPPLALRMGDIHAGTGGVTSCAEAGSGHQGDCLPGTSATGECLNDGGGALDCLDLGNSPQNFPES